VVRDIEQELLPLCLNKGIGVVAWGPMAGGFLTGKYKPGERSVPGTRSEDNWVFPSRYFGPNTDDTLATLLEVAKRIGARPAQVALRWALSRLAITSVIVGSRNTEQFTENLKTTDLKLDDDTLQTLTEVSHLPDRYPESMEKNMNERRNRTVTG
jgi:aryl-alcohol dehydrogenase-like predicted oxidoreductase